MEQTTETLRVKNGTTCSIGYDCIFQDASKKTITIGSYRAQDIPNNATFKQSVSNFNSGGYTEMKEHFTTANGSPIEAITGVTITVKAINVLIG